MHEVDFIEACYRPEPDASAWAADLCRLAEHFFPDSRGISCHQYRLSGAAVAVPWSLANEPAHELIERSGRSVTHVVDMVRGTPNEQDLIQGLYGAPSAGVAVTSDLPGASGALIRRALPLPGGDAIGLLATVRSGSGVIIGSLTEGPARLTHRRRAHLLALCRHVAAGFALREATATGVPAEEELPVAGVFSVDGRLVEADVAVQGPRARHRLSDAVRRMDRARCRRRRTSPEETLRLWRAFVGGHYTLLESFDRGGRRTMLAVRVRSDFRLLGKRERQVAALVAQGLSNKAIAAQLGTATSTVSVHLRAILSKLGYRHRSELVVAPPTWTDD